MCALVKFGGGVAGMSGKLGGTVFARNKSGAYSRNWVNPINPNTTKQQTVRNQFANLISGWKNLSAADQQAWADMAPQYPYINRVGETSEYSGQQLYNHLNMNLQVVGTTPLTAPLVPQTFSNIRLITLDLQLTAGVLTTADVETDDNGAATEAVILEVTTSLSGGITKPAKGLFKQVLILADASTSAGMDITSEYQALYGDPELGAKVFIRGWLINKNTGQRLNLGQVEDIVSGT